MKTSTFLIGLATGAVGAAITVLFSTPQSGSEMRTSVKNASTDIKEKFTDVKEKLDNLKDSLRHLKKEAKETIPETVEEMKDAVSDWQQATLPNRARMEQEIADIQSAIEELERSIAAQQK
ncbi:YtxH domain-containing protein [Sporosarcina sp. 179-K 3D1 HS]|uniref:YtxH domain-containing protein n=1 Tax=Sporosarcina sp. 179-K 3D1 HS TaxID=3232169 RepID=UPI00399F2AA1